MNGCRLVSYSFRQMRMSMCGAVKPIGRGLKVTTRRRKYRIFTAFAIIISDCYAPGYVFASDNKHMDYISFQPYGSGFWDFQRMRALGFLGTYSDSDKTLSLCNAIFTWESIINEDNSRKRRLFRGSTGKQVISLEKITILDKPKD